MGNQTIHRLLSLKDRGEDINQQLKTVQGANIKIDTYGVKWDKEFEKLLSLVVGSHYQILLHEKFFYIDCGGKEYLRIRYGVEGEDQDIYVDFNSMKLYETEVEGCFIVPLYKRMKNGEACYSSKYFQEAETYERVFVVAENPKGNHFDTKEACTPYLLEAIIQWDKEWKEKNKKTEKLWKLTEYIEEKLQEKGVSKSELGAMIGIKYKTLISKFKIDSFTGDELIRIGIVLDLDLNELKVLYNKHDKLNKITPDKETMYIASLIRLGFASGIVPAWELIIPQEQLYPLNRSEQHLVADEVEQGHLSGYLSSDFSRGWRLSVGEQTIKSG